MSEEDGMIVENPSDEERHEAGGKLVMVKSLHNEIEASIVKTLLETAGVQCALITPVPHNVYPFTIDGLAEIRVTVLESDLEAARTIIEDYESTAADQSSPREDDPQSH